MVFDRVLCFSRRSACLIYLLLSVVTNVTVFVLGFLNFELINVTSPLELVIVLISNASASCGLHKVKSLTFHGRQAF